MILNKKVLIWNDFELSPRKGGPSTYLWHLKEFAVKNNISELVFLDAYRKVMHVDSKPASEPTGNWRHPLSLLKKILGKKVKQNVQLLRSILSRRLEVDELGVNLADFDIIHFHSALSLERALPLIKNVTATIVFTSHSPKISHKEIIEDWCKMDIKDVFPFLYRRCEAIDKKAFKRADLVVFPCEEAQEPYYNTWSKYAGIIQNKQLLFLPTGIISAKVSESASSVRERLGIPDTAIVFCFAGRHNQVKGYDILKKAAENILPCFPDVYFLIAGAPGPIDPLTHQRWVEVGWTNDPYSIINAANCFVLPNRETYFDLILLEVLSLGKNIILSDSGGNKFFKQYKSQEMFYFKTDNVESLIDVITQFVTNTKQQQTANKINIEIFNAHFTQTVFGSRYLEMYNQIK